MNTAMSEEGLRLRKVVICRVDYRKPRENFGIHPNPQSMFQNSGLGIENTIVSYGYCYR